MSVLQRGLSLVAFCLLVTAPCAFTFAAEGAPPVADSLRDTEVRTKTFTGHFVEGSLSQLDCEPLGRLVHPPAESRGWGVHRIGGEYWSAKRRLPSSYPTGESPTEGFSTNVEGTFSVDAPSGDLVLRQHCSGKAEGVWGVSWEIGDIPLEYAIIVPGRSGVRLTPETASRREQFDYPIGWEAQLVIVEGPKGGFYVWADDVQGRYKRLLVERSASGWRLTLTTLNNAPFDRFTECESVAWHLNVYQGDWRVPAGRYRDWAEQHFQPVKIEQQKPGWIKDIRCVVIMGLNTEMLEALPERLDPQQTILYIPSWRAAGYDRDYPVYDQPLEGLQPFVKRAHAMGFRVMLHVNYFGVDPLNPLYEQFAPFQVRDPWGEHPLKWWHWTRAEPEIRFAYINPAHAAWRRTFVDAMVRLCRDCRIDSLHLDQTLCIYNDHNGLRDGATMLQGNLILHEELRKALPDVALSGEGLNEITYRHEAFAQRHAWGVNHAEGTWDRRRLAAAHPISSYLFRPYTIINGYLGCAPPTAGQLYAAWNEAYEHWGVIPTLKPSLEQVREPTEFFRQFFDEVRFFQDSELTIDMDSDWPAEVAFPWRTANGKRAVRTSDGCLRCGESLISRTITGVTEIESPGRIPGWRGFDSTRLLGLDPARWYPWQPEPRSDGRLHVSELPDHALLESVADWGPLGMVRVSTRSSVVADLIEIIDSARGGSVPQQGDSFETLGPFVSDDGGKFELAADDTLSAHPPYKPGPTIGPGVGSFGAGERVRLAGTAYLRYRLTLPSDVAVQLNSHVSVDEGSVGQLNSDGVTFTVTAWPVGESGDKMQVLRAEVHAVSAKQTPLDLDLTSLAGQDVYIELAVHPGPKGLPSFDWARWHSPRIVRESSKRDRVRISGDVAYRLAISGGGSMLLPSPGGDQSVELEFPGSVFLLKERPRPVELPLDLAVLMKQISGKSHFVGYFDETGRWLDEPGITSLHPSNATVAGVERHGIWAHPPDAGSAALFLPMALPQRKAEFHSWIGIRDGSRSTGVVFCVRVNGCEVARQHMLPGQWESLSADLSPWQGQAIVLTLETDSDGSHYFDWAHWGEPRIEAMPD